ncbi:MAG TPA: TlpA family protein disulfide reductase [Deltaproteobacteria bacterium]|nr:TlpA family protein disulfide reductase [Deltaproteobacteria bacterium]
MRPAAFVLSILAVGCTPRLYTQAGQDLQPWIAPENDWPLSPPPEGTVAGGFDVGAIVPDLRLVDQFGDEVSLWQFYGKVILLDVSTMWCAPCRDLAEHTEETNLRFGDDLIYVTILQETTEGAPPEQEDLELWVEAYGITSPVVADPDRLSYDAIRQNLRPAVLAIDRDLTIVERVNPPNDEEVQAAIEAVIGG